MNFAERYRTDRDLEEEGAWVDLGDGIKIKIARLQSQRARRVLARLYRPYDNMRQSGRKVPDSVQETVTRRWIAEGVLLDWEGVSDAAGKTIPFTPDSALEVFEAFPDFLDEVVYFSREQETFRAERLETVKGNSPRRSAGS
jgi:hypothetical protein